MSDVAKIAGRLTEAQRRYLSERAEFRKPTAWAEPRWMTFPPPSTHSKLMALGLVGKHGNILDAGLAIREHLKGEKG